MLLLNNVYFCHFLLVWEYRLTTAPLHVVAHSPCMTLGPLTPRRGTAECHVFQPVPLSVLHWELLVFSRPSCSAQPGTLTVSLYR